MTQHLWKFDVRKRCCRTFLLILLLTIATTSGLQAGVTLQWDANSESDLAGYNLYRSGSSGGPYSKLNGSLISTTSYTDNTIIAGNTYYYVCTAVNTSGLESGYSNQESYVLDIPNDPPVAVDDSALTVMNYGVTVSVLANDTDPNGDALQVTGVTQGAHGSVTFTATSVRYTPAINFFGTDSFSYSISDGRGGTDTALVSVVISKPNTAPNAVNDSATVPTNTATPISVLANDVDADGDSFVIVAVTQPSHGATFYASSSVTYTPENDYTGIDSFTYTIADGKGGTDSATVSVTVTSTNHPPTAANDSASVAEDGTVTIAVTANDSDVDGDTLTISGVTQGAHGAVAINGGTTVTYTPQAGYSGSDSFNYTISDGHGGSASAAVSVQVVQNNSQPVAANDSASVLEDSSVVVNVTANDSDPDGDTLTVSSAGAPLHGSTSVVSSTSVRYTPSANYNGSDSFSYTISDGKGGTATATVAVTVSAVNDFPSAHNDSASTQEDHSVTITVLSNDEDVDGDVLNVTSVGAPQHGAAVKNGDGSVSYTPASNFSGSDSFSYAISDGKGGTSAATVSVTVTGVNDAPSAVNDAVTLQEDTSATVSVLNNDSDPDGDSLTVSAAGQPQHGTTAVQNGTSVRYTPAANYHGSDTFTYTISDGNGGTATAAVAVTVNSVNDVPKAQNDTASTPEGQSVTVAVLANDSDDDGDSLALSSVGSPSHGTAVKNGNNTVTYTPSANFNGSDAFTYAISDGQGGTASALVNVTVSSVSDAPVANDDVATTPEDSSAVIGVTANDTDADGDTLTVTAVTQPQHGTAAVEATGSVRYTPAANYYGSDAFSYTVSDGSESSTAQVLVTVTSINDVPTASADTVTTLKNQAVSVPVLSNDSDVDEDTLTVTGVTQPQHGSATITGGTAVQYTPADNYSGSDTFSYTVGDGNGGVAGATVTVTIAATNDGPTAVADTVVISEDQPLVFNPAANDTDPDGDVLSVQSVSQPSHGTVTVESATSVRYTPAADYNGADSFGYTVADPAGLISSATVSVTVTPVNDAPVAGDDVATVAPGQSVTIAILVNDSDVDGDQLSISSINNAPHGTVTKGPEQVLLYTPKNGYEGTDAFKYTISDGNGGTASANVQITVTASSNQPPEAVADSVTTAEDQSVTIPVLGNDSDPDGDILSVSSLTAPQHGTATRQSGETVLYVPASNYNGSDAFSYTVSDGKGGSTTGTVSVTVTPVNDPPQPVADSITVEQGRIGVGLCPGQRPGSGWRRHYSQSSVGTTEWNGGSPG